MDHEESGTIDARISAAVRGLMVLLVPLGAAIGAHYSTKSALEANIRTVRSDVNHYRELTDGKIERIRADFDQLRNQLHSHTALGPDGLAHPQGVVIKIEQLKDDIQDLKKDFDEFQKRLNKQ